MALVAARSQPTTHMPMFEGMLGNHWYQNLFWKLCTSESIKKISVCVCVISICPVRIQDSQEPTEAQNP
jgi:hypothetical protein